MFVLLYSSLCVLKWKISRITGVCQTRIFKILCKSFNRNGLVSPMILSATYVSSRQVAHFQSFVFLLDIKWNLLVSNSYRFRVPDFSDHEWSQSDASIDCILNSALITAVRFLTLNFILSFRAFLAIFFLIQTTLVLPTLAMFAAIDENSLGRAEL